MCENFGPDTSRTCRYWLNVNKTRINWFEIVTTLCTCVVVKIVRQIESGGDTKTCTRCFYVSTHYVLDRLPRMLSKYMYYEYTYYSSLNSILPLDRLVLKLNRSAAKINTWNYHNYAHAWWWLVKCWKYMDVRVFWFDDYFPRLYCYWCCSIKRSRARLHFCHAKHGKCPQHSMPRPQRKIFRASIDSGPPRWKLARIQTRSSSQLTYKNCVQVFFALRFAQMHAFPPQTSRYVYLRVWICEESLLEGSIILS